MRRRSAAIIVAIVLCTGVIVAGVAAWARAGNRQLYREAAAITGGGNAQHGREKIRTYGCQSCHTIPGVPGGHGLVGPPLADVKRRMFLAGELPNTPDNLMLWIQHPHSVEPHTVMPEMGVTEEDSRDIAAYLYALP
jgi:cytochrome c